MRKASFDRYVDDPYDGAAPSAIVNALARLKRGELLSPASTARLLSIMGNTKTGANRLKGGLKPGWTLSHKTGTGQVLGGVQAGYNDIGILTAPDGRSYAVAVMIKRTSTPLPTRMTLMNNVVRAVIDQHEMSYGAAYTLLTRRPGEARRARPASSACRRAKLELFIVRDFLDPTPAPRLIERIDAQRRPSEIADDIGVAAFRTSETCDLDWRDPVVAAVDQQIAELLGLPLERQRAAAGAALCAGAGVQAAHRHVRARRRRFLRALRRARASGRGRR